MTEAAVTEPPSESVSHHGQRSRRPAVLVLLAVAAVAFLVDLGTKHLALAELADRDPVRLLGGTVYLTLTRNSGAAWSIGADHTWIFSLITLAVIGFIGWLAYRLRSVPWAVALGLILGGALGNFTDRVFRAPGAFVGHVVDMVSLFEPYGRVWPIFNLADSALVAGVTLAILLEFTGRQRDGTRLVAGARSAARSTPVPAASQTGSDGGPAQAVSQTGSDGRPATPPARDSLNQDPTATREDR